MSTQSSEVKVGMRLRCEACGSEAIVTKPGGAELTCCDRPLAKTFQPAGDAPAE